MALQLERERGGQSQSEGFLELFGKAARRLWKCLQHPVASVWARFRQRGEEALLYGVSSRRDNRRFFTERRYNAGY